MRYSFTFIAAAQLGGASSSRPVFIHRAAGTNPKRTISTFHLLNSVMKRTRSPSRYQLRPRKASLTCSTLVQASPSNTSDEEEEHSGDVAFSVNEESVSDASESSLDSESLPKTWRGSAKSRKNPARLLAQKQASSSAGEAPEAVLPLSNAPDSFSASEVKFLQDMLLSWYAEHHREFPWRTKPVRLLRETNIASPSEPIPESAAGAPYAVWVSEVMSQQTRIEVVVGYFTRWMLTFPTLRALADAPLERVNELWAGLGYYRRARFLHEGARQIVSAHGGVIPNEASALRKIPGIGQYTSGAIASISFGRPEPAVDGNVERVLSRLRPGVAARTPGAKPAARAAAFDKLARLALTDVECPGDFNQALMELGATVCKPRGALCGTCPVRALCGAHAEAVEAGVARPEEYVVRYPIKDPRKRVKVRSETVAVCVACVRERGAWRFLVTQRQGTGLLSGLWEAPNTVLANGADEEISEDIFEAIALRSAGKALGDASVECLDELGIEWRDAARVTHIFSHIRQTLFVKVAILNPNFSSLVTQAGGIGDIPFQWSSASELMEKAVSTQMLKVFRSAGKVIGQKILKAK